MIRWRHQGVAPSRPGCVVLHATGLFMSCSLPRAAAAAAVADVRPEQHGEMCVVKEVITCLLLGLLLLPCCCCYRCCLGCVQC